MRKSSRTRKSSKLESQDEKSNKSKKRKINRKSSIEKDTPAAAAFSKTQKVILPPPLLRKKIEVILGNNDKDEVYDECFRGYELKKVLGRGAYGSVASLCLKDDCNYAVKMMRTAVVEPNEIEIIKKLSNMGIGPRFIDMWTCPAVEGNDGDTVSFIVSEKWDGELPVGICLPTTVLQKLCVEISKLGNAGFVHGDILEKNVLVKYNNKKTGIIDATLTDFGTVETVKEWKQNKAFGRKGDGGKIAVFFTYHFKAGLAQYYLENNLELKDVQANPQHLDKALMWKLWKLCKKDPQECFEF